jgi:hypothetical protein
MFEVHFSISAIMPLFCLRNRYMFYKYASKEIFALKGLELLCISFLFREIHVKFHL